MIVVVGAGMAGLAAAWELSHTLPGSQITVLDAADRAGGKLRQEEVAGHRVDVGAEAMLAARPEALDLIASLGALDRLVHPVTTAARVWSRGDLHPLPAGSLMGVPGDPGSIAGVLQPDEVARASHEQPWGGATSDDGRLHADVSVGDYVAARLGDAVVDRLVEPLLGGVYAGHARRLSLQACVPALFAAAQRGDSLLGTARRLAPAPATPQRPRRPAFAGLAGGMGLLPGVVVDALTRRGVGVRTATIARELGRTPTGWQVVTGPVPRPEVLDADAVILAVPAGAAARLLSAHAPIAAGELAGIETASMAVLTLALPRRGLPPLTGSGFLVPPAEGRTIKASTFSSAKWAWTDALDPELVYVRASVGRHGQEGDLQREDGQLLAAAHAEIGDALGIALPRPVDGHVQRWGGGLPQYAVGHVDRVARIMTDLTSLPGVELAGAAYDGVGIPAVIGSGTRAARRALRPASASAGSHTTTLAPESRREDSPS